MRGAAGAASRYRAKPLSGRPRSGLVAYRPDLEGDFAGRRGRGDLVADRGADERLGGRRDPGDAALPGNRLVLADDGEFALRAGRVGDHDPGGEGDLVARLRRRVDEDGALDAGFEIADLARDIGQRQGAVAAVAAGEEVAAPRLCRGQAPLELGEPARRHVVRMAALRQIGDLAGAALGILLDEGSAHDDLQCRRDVQSRRLSSSSFLAFSSSRDVLSRVSLRWPKRSRLTAAWRSAARRSRFLRNWLRLTISAISGPLARSATVWQAMPAVIDCRELNLVRRRHPAMLLWAMSLRSAGAGRIDDDAGREASCVRS